MDVYTLMQESLDFDQVLDEYTSLVWTERHVEAGEVNLVVPATADNYSLLRPGTPLGVINSRQLMLIDTRSVENGLLTATGPSMETFLDERNNGPLDLTDTPGSIMAAIVQNMIDRQYETWLPGLQIGYVEQGDGEKVHEVVPAGPCYTNVLNIARKYGLNFGLYREHETFIGWGLYFSVHMGKDLTSDQKKNKVVRFSPNLDSLAAPKDLTSDKDHKNTVVCYPPPGMVFTIGGEPFEPSPITVSSVPDWETFYQPWRMRVKELNSDGLTMAMLGPDDATDDDRLAKLNLLMSTRAELELKKLGHTDMVDGEITPEAQYAYKDENSDDSRTTYDMGDRVEFQGHFGEVRKGLVTEHTRSSDSSGARAYPVISDKRAPVLRQGLIEQVVAVFGGSELAGFWEHDDGALTSSVGKPQFWTAPYGEKIVENMTDLSKMRDDAVKMRFRWGMNHPVDEHFQYAHYLEYPTPHPHKPPASTEVQASVNEMSTDDEAFITFMIESTAGGDYGVWLADTEEWWLYADHASPTRTWTDRVVKPVGPMIGTSEYENFWVHGWAAITQLWEDEVSVAV